MLLLPSAAIAQSTGSLRGQILDPTGAVVPGATVTLTQGPAVKTAQSGGDGVYSFKVLSPGSYTLEVQAAGFAAFSKTGIVIASGQARQENVSLSIAIQQQDITVNDQAAGASINPDENASAMVVKGSDLDALSDDPDELQNELQALAGPAAGPSGGQIYIDGFTGGQIPPKSSIREIRVNQNPFSAEFDKIGYGRIEILTKPGSDKFSGHITSLGNDSAWNTANPLVSQQPSYYLYFLQGDVNGPLSKNASYFASAFHFDRQNQSIINAVNPEDPSTPFSQALPNPSSLLVVSPRVDLQLGKSNTLSIRDNYVRSLATANGPGQLSLPEQAFNVTNQENAIQLSDTVVVSPHVLNETRFQWRRVRNNQVASFFTPTVTVQGAFTTGGSNSGIVRDHQDLFELQNYSTLTARSHTIRFGVRLRADRDANYSTSGANGDYLFTSIDQYLAQTPAQYQSTVIQNPLVRAILFDGALFYQDDWRARPNLTLSYGLRFETQNRIRDHADWGPRFSLAWAPGHMGKTPPKTVVRAGYGWFYDRFTVPTSFFSIDGAPYIMQAIHQNGSNQQSYVINNPDFYDPNAPASPGTLANEATSVPSIYSVDHHFHAALSMQGGVGIDRQIAKKVMFNATYLFTRGVHQYLTNNVTAPEFDPSTYTVIGPIPSVYNYQFQSGGIYKQNQIIVSTNAQLHHLTLHGSYTFNQAKSDTQGVNYVPSVAQDPGLDYGRATFGITNRLFLIGTYAAPHGITIAPLLAAQSGTPYNLVTGGDFTANNQFNARPTYGTCGAPDVISTPYGCLDSNPVGKGEKIVPYGAGIGPANFVMHMRVSKVIGIGPRIEGSKGPGGPQGGNGSVNGRGLSGGGAPPKLDAAVSRKYSLTLVGGALNIFNIVNLGTPNGTLASPLFGKTQSLANGPFGSPTPGNRAIFVQAIFTF
ncbi:MAG: carboxypeptidase regulatory-like domain-containing protein [Acidobacteriaceae bacterium]